MTLLTRIAPRPERHQPPAGLTSHPDNAGRNLRRMTHDTLFQVASLLDPGSLRNWRATCSVADRTGSYALDHRYNSTLAGFVKDPTSLRNVLRVSRSVISGSTALHVLDVDRAASWSPTDLDIYTPNSSSAVVINYLVAVEGYVVVVDTRRRYPYISHGFASVTHLRRGDIDIDVIRSNTTSALHPIPFFWSNHLMNFLTADSFCIAYPDHTLLGRGLLNPHAMIEYQYPPPRMMRTMKKYKKRGYAFRSRPTAWNADTDRGCTGGPSCPKTVRYFGDKHCLTGSFTSHAQPSPHDRALPDASRTVRWWRGGPPCGHNCQHPIFGDMRSIPSVRTVRSCDVM